MTNINENFIGELFNWYYKGINIGEAVLKQIKPIKLPEVEVEDGVDETGRTILYTKPKCPNCDQVAYSGKYCQHCGKRLR